MKGNDGTGNVKERDDWETPKELFNKLNKQYSFFIDCCATRNNSKCVFYYKDFEVCDFLPDNMFCWMNPPFSKAYEMFEHFFKVVSVGVAIYRCDNMETKLWQDIILKNASWILIPKGRINYDGKTGKGSRFPSALIGYKVDLPKHIKGSVLICKNVKKNETIKNY